MEGESSGTDTRMDAPHKKIPWGKFIGSLGILIAMPAIVLFCASGRLDWFWGWVYVGLTAIFTIGSRVTIAIKVPELVAERGEALQKEDVKLWDRVLLPLAFLLPLMMLIIAGLDNRFGWSPGVPLAIHVTGLILTAAGYVLSSWAMVVNRFFSASVRIQAEREHRVVSAGPYRFIRHPGYAGSILSTVTFPLFLGTLWALIPAILAVISMVIRTGLEDATLKEELDSYRAYSVAVRYRLVPGFW